MMKSYKSTVLACYVANFVQAIVINTTPVLFIPLREQFGLSYKQLGLLVLVNFITQVTADLAFSRAVDKYGYRPFIVATPFLATIGLLLFAFSPDIFTVPYRGFIMATILFSAAGGLLELLLSPIINAIPTKEKAQAMSLLHSFYAWGQLTVVLLTTLFIFAFGYSAWRWVFILWAIVPFVNIFMFVYVPLAPVAIHATNTSMWHTIRSPFFVIALLAIVFGAATEVSIAQWLSSFMEKGMNIPKIVGDVGGVCLFATAFGIGRMLYGIKGDRIDIYKAMIGGSWIALGCYFALALSPNAALSLIICGIAGLSVSLLWPGILVVTAARYPLAGTWLFAFLAAGGDIGSAFGPWLIGYVADISQNSLWGLSPEQIGLRTGILVGAIFPLITLGCLRWLKGK